MKFPLTPSVYAAAAACMLATTAPAGAAETFASDAAAQAVTGVGDAWQNSRNRGWRNDNRRSYDRRGYNQRAYYDEPVTRNTRVWRGNDGRNYCRKKDGTTGLIIGGAVGALLGREVDGGRNRSLGTILGAAGGALLGRSVDRGGSSCR